jgi:outer membrane lipoprotein
MMRNALGGERKRGETAGSIRTASIIVSLIVLSACNSYRVIPQDLEPRVQKQTGIRQVLQDPSAHQGELVVWGGEVLQATRTKQATRLEVLQIPLTDDLTPAGDRAESQGRFLAFDRQGEILDPAVVREGTRVTIVGEVQPPVPGTSETGPPVYPSIAIRDMTIWEKKASRDWGYPYYGPYYGHYYYGYRPYVFWDGTRVPAASQ